MTPSPAFRSGSGLALVMVLGGMIALAAAAIDISLPAIPLMAEALNASPGAGQWVVTSYLAGFALGQIPIGAAADRWGRRATTLWALLAFLLGAALAASAERMDVLLSARFAQGLAGAAGPVLARAIARDLARDGDATAFLSILLSILGLAPLVAPLLGAALLAFAGWRAPLYFVALYAAILLASVALFLPETRSLALPERPKANASIGRALRAPQFVRGALLASLAHAGYLALVTSSSTILRADYGIGAAPFAWLFALAAGAFCLGPMATRRFSKSMNDKPLSTLGVACVAAASVGLAALAALQAPPIAALWTCVVVYLFGHGMTAPMFSAQALAPLGEAAGMAAALLGTLQICLGFIGSLAVSQMTALGGAGLAIVMAAAGLTAASIYWLGESGRP